MNRKGAADDAGAFRGVTARLEAEDVWLNLQQTTDFAFESEALN